MELDKLNKIYFLGIGGIGMSAIARHFLSKGSEIYGYDLAKSSLTKKLETEGMNIHYDIDVDKIPNDIDLVVLTPAIPDDHAELMWFRENGYPIKKRAEVLGMLSRNYETIAVAGTHGKTTTSCLITHILKYCGTDVTAFLGGIMSGYESNFFSGNSDIMIAEADEYDRSFLHLRPTKLIILSLDADHLDIYENHSSLYRTYEQLCHNIKDDGELYLACNPDGKFSENWREALKEKNINVYQLGSDFEYTDVKVANNTFEFNYRSSDVEIKDLISRIPGEHNIINSSIAISIALELGLDTKMLAESLENFKGIKRRFELLNIEGKVLFDDYAHHPSELEFAVSTIKHLYPDKKVLGIFQAHLYSRTQDFYRGFAEALESMDEIWLLPIYPAREKAIPGVKAEMIYNLIRNENKRLLKAEDLVTAVEEKDDFDVMITLGASDLDKYHGSLIEVLKKKH